MMTSTIIQWVLANCKFAAPLVQKPMPKRKSKPAPKPPQQFSYPPIEGTEDEVEDYNMDKAETYFGLGHGEEENEHGSNPKTHVVWVLLGRDEIDTAPGNKTHGAVWGHDFADKTWKGRYEGDTGRLSIAGPGAYSQPPSWLMDLLSQKFGFISEVHSF